MIEEYKYFNAHSAFLLSYNIIGVSCQFRLFGRGSNSCDSAIVVESTQSLSFRFPCQACLRTLRGSTRHPGRSPLWQNTVVLGEPCQRASAKCQAVPRRWPPQSLQWLLEHLQGRMHLLAFALHVSGNACIIFSIIYLALFGRYLNTQHIRKSKLGDAEMRFVDSAMQQVEQMEIGELGV